MQLHPRELVDDVSIQYAGPNPDGVRHLDKAVQLFRQDSFDLGSRFNLSKSGDSLILRSTR